MSLNNNDYKILTCIVNVETKRGLLLGNGSTLKQIIERTGFSQMKVRTTIKKLLEIGYVVEGVKKVKSKTYCVTDKGAKRLKELKELLCGEEFLQWIKRKYYC